MTGFQQAFPLPYAHWYAATLFMDAGQPPSEVFSLLGLDAETWDAFNQRYRSLHFSGTSWVSSSYKQQGLPDPAFDQKLFADLFEGGSVTVKIKKPFDMRAELKLLRAQIEAAPRIGPFEQVDWIAQYLCERQFPTIRYVHDGHHVFVAGKPLANRKGEVIDEIDPFSFRKT